MAWNITVACPFSRQGSIIPDHISTVSPTYAREIQTAPLGFGMQGLLASRSKAYQRHLNGIAAEEWDPRTDPNLARNYSIANLAAKSTNKKALQQLLGLAENPQIPLFGAVSRITYQKGYDLLLQSGQRADRNTGPTGNPGQRRSDPRNVNYRYWQKIIREKSPCISALMKNLHI